MLVRLLDDERGDPLWVNAQQVQVIQAKADGRTTLILAGGQSLAVRGSAPEVATQLQDALAGRKYVDFWSS